MLRLVQSVLLVFCAACAGAVAAAGAAFVVGLMVFPSGRDAGGAVVAFVVLAAGGGVIGALTGVVGALRWIARQSGELWTLGAWLGALAGLAAGLAVRVAAVFEGNVLGDVVAWLPGMIVFLAALAFLGGWLGGSTTAWINRTAPERRRKPK